ncbi:MAG TPA: bifunctional lysine ketoglutarate reductase /saccharopine dehydrogenase family protein [Bacteroidales bacterium]
MQIIGIRYEDKYKMERRVPLIPEHVKILSEAGLKFEVESSGKRIFTDEEFAEAGAEIVEKIDKAGFIMGVKEMPLDFFQEGKSYIFFSHVIKGQPYNMPMLRKMMAKKVNLIDYEKIVNEKGQRMIFFGRYAGIAGIINSFWALGQRWSREGYQSPFLKLQQTHQYDSLDEAKDVIREIGDEIKSKGLKNAKAPVVVGITGYGNASKGVQDILELLPVVKISPAELLQLEKKHIDNKVIYQVVFKEEDLFKPKKENVKFVLQEYYDFPERFESQFDQYIPHITVLMNCIYWNERYPRLVTKNFLNDLFSKGKPKFAVIGDVTCDVNGSIECTHKGTEIEDPVFVYNPITRTPTMGFDGEGVLVMAVDILPSELPREASKTFSDALLDFVPEIASADFEKPFSELKLSPPIKKALILHKGNFTPDYQYLEEFI